MAKELKPIQDTESDSAVPEVQGPPKSYRLHITLGFVSLILFQVILLWLILPAKQSPTRYRGGLDPTTGTRGFEDSAPIPPGIIKPEDVVERSINGGRAFTGKITKKGSDVTESYSLVMHVTVKSKEAKKFDKRYADCQQTIIDRVSGMLRINVAEYYYEAGHTTLKEKAKKEINGVLGTPWVQSVLISGDSYTEQ